jgi:hypothetical protein
LGIGSGLPETRDPSEFRVVGKGVPEAHLTIGFMRF